MFTESQMESEATSRAFLSKLSASERYYLDLAILSYYCDKSNSKIKMTPDTKAKCYCAVRELKASGYLRCGVGSENPEDDTYKTTSDGVELLRLNGMLSVI